MRPGKITDHKIELVQGKHYKIINWDMGIIIDLMQNGGPVKVVITPSYDFTWTYRRTYIQTIEPILSAVDPAMSHDEDTYQLKKGVRYFIDLNGEIETWNETLVMFIRLEVNQVEPTYVEE